MSDFTAAIDNLQRLLVEATAKASLEGGMLVEGLAKANAPVKTGTLKRSIDTSGPRPTGAVEFTTLVGPTVIYGRLRELGGWIPGGATPQPKTDASRPQWLHWVDEAGGEHFARLVHQTGRPYLKPAVEASRARFRALCANRWAGAIRAATI